jgi:hypothetical protein
MGWRYMTHVLHFALLLSHIYVYYRDYGYVVCGDGLCRDSVTIVSSSFFCKGIFLLGSISLNVLMLYRHGCIHKRNMFNTFSFSL